MNWFDDFYNAITIVSSIAPIVLAVLGFGIYQNFRKNEELKLREYVISELGLDEEFYDKKTGGSDNNKDSELSKKPAEKAFESVALQAYYRQALLHSSVSFWFSLIFAAIGFFVIVSSFVAHDSSDWITSALKIGSGVIIDGVSLLFFTLSREAQRSMTEFFEKLRDDRSKADARELISEIANTDAADELRMQLVLKYTGIDKLIVGNPRPHP